MGCRGCGDEPMKQKHAAPNVPAPARICAACGEPIVAPAPFAVFGPASVPAWPVVAAFHLAHLPPELR